MASPPPDPPDGAGFAGPPDDDPAGRGWPDGLGETADEPGLAAGVPVVGRFADAVLSGIADEDEGPAGLGEDDAAGAGEASLIGAAPPAGTVTGLIWRTGAF